MGRLAEADESLFHYLQNLGQSNEDYIVGLISGQPAQNKDLIIHLARTPETKVTNEDYNENESIKISAVSHKKKNFNKSLSAISDNWIANHALYTTRMLPGGMFVLGIFVVSPDSLFENKVHMIKIVSMLAEIYKVLQDNKYLHALPEHNSAEKLILHFNTTSKSYACKSINIDQLDLNLITVDWKFVPKARNPDWFQLDCYYELDDIFPLKTNNNGVSIKCQYEAVLSFISKIVWSATMFVDGEVKDSDMTLESILLQKNSNDNKNDISEKGSQKSLDENASEVVDRNLCISMFVPSDSSSPPSSEPLKEKGTVVKLPGSVSFSGVVSSSVWMHNSCKLSEAHNAIRSDIIRSLQARIQICCDSLDTDTVEDRIVISEPPRRVLIPLKSKVCFSDYIFNGETTSEAVLSAREVLDLLIEEDKIIADIEHPADNADESVIKPNLKSEESLENSPGNQGHRDTNTIMIISGIVIALLVLLLSLFVNFYYNLN
uniref:Putative olfactory receptor 4-like protein n=1 Tax=Xenopsylla cheopis TaxID=163159 RepID=A0A6M2DFX0_XENCH